MAVLLPFAKGFLVPNQIDISPLGRKRLNLDDQYIKGPAGLNVHAQAEPKNFSLFLRTECTMSSIAVPGSGSLLYVKRQSICHLKMILTRLLCNVISEVELAF